MQTSSGSCAGAGHAACLRESALRQFHGARQLPHIVHHLLQSRQLLRALRLPLLVVRGVQQHDAHLRGVDLCCCMQVLRCAKEVFRGGSLGSSRRLLRGPQAQLLLVVPQLQRQGAAAADELLAVLLHVLLADQLLLQRAHAR